MLNQAESNGIKNYNIYSVLLGGKRSKMSFTRFYHPSVKRVTQTTLTINFGIEKRG